MSHYGLLGEKLSHSYSPQIHHAFGIEHYELYEKKPEELEDFLKNSQFDGLNVTIPYKQSVIPYCAELSDAAKAIGSVNTIIRQKDGSLFGDNTDVDGFKLMVKTSQVNIFGKKALVFGSGGASLTACYVLKTMGANPVITISRSGKNNYENLFLHQDAEILVNTTPLGMFPNNGTQAVKLENFPHAKLALDVVYNPSRTAFILNAEELHIPNRDGLLMLVEQARQSILRWHPQYSLKITTNDVLASLRKQMNNLILIGMPGSGKTTIGTLLSTKTGREFIDTDDVITKRIGMSISDYFSNFGEESFRKIETQIANEIGKLSGKIIATGGGIVTRKENYNLLHQNGSMICLKRNFNISSTEGRPLLVNNSLDDLYNSRKKLYEYFADIMIDNNTTLEETAEKVWEAYNEISHY